MPSPSSASPRPPLEIDTVSELRQFIGDKRRQHPDICVSFVPTMGALHDGHLELVRRARHPPPFAPSPPSSSSLATSTTPIPALVVVSIFVNPLQFGPAEDLDRYPRTLAEDLAKLRGLADCVFVPEKGEILPENEAADGVRVDAGRIGQILEGERRPNYFGGVLTIVAKLFNCVQPDVALFGQKDAQQLFAIQQMVRMLNFPIRIIPVETKREWDGLAMSSRNRYLSQQERQTSLCLWKALEAAKLRADGGASLAQVLEEGRRVFGQESGGKAQLDYLEAVEAETFEKVEDADGFHGRKALVLLLIAAFVGATRLIDNIHIQI